MTQAPPVDLSPGERKALEKLGWPSDRWFSKKGKVLALLALHPEMGEHEAYRQAGVPLTTARAWKSKAESGTKDEIYAEALARAQRRPRRAVRRDAPWPANLDTPTLKARAESCMRTFTMLGPGPWRRKDEINRSIHNETREALMAINRELGHRGVPAYDVPPEPAPLPKKRWRHPILRSVR